MYRSLLHLSTKGEGDIIDLTPDVQKVVKESGVRDGMVNVFVTGSTAALTTIEFETGVLADLRGALARIAPDEILYAHDSRWGNGNGRSHVRASLVGPSLSIPLSRGELMLGTWASRWCCWNST